MVDKSYRFNTPQGVCSLSDLFGRYTQLIVQHFMFQQDWEAGCKSCSFMADHMDPAVIHLAARDTAFTVSIATIDKIEAYKARMGWSFPWVSSAGTDFNRDFCVSFTEDELANQAARYNYQDHTGFPCQEAPGISVFVKEGSDIYHTYSVYGRGLEKTMTTYDLLDMVPKGRDEGGNNMVWLRRKDEYDNE